MNSMRNYIYFVCIQSMAYAFGNTPEECAVMAAEDPVLVLLSPENEIVDG
jgi:hypothetical protein